MLLKTIIRAVALSLLLSLAAFGARAQSLPVIPFHYLSAVSNNSTLVSGAGQNVLKWVIVYNNNATIYYLKFYNKATAPACGTDTPVITIPLPPTGTSTGVLPISFDDTRFSLGIGFCIVALPADNDNGNAAAGITLNIGYLWQ
jgi:hypothetical protein